MQPVSSREETFSASRISRTRLCLWEDREGENRQSPTSEVSEPSVRTEDSLLLILEGLAGGGHHVVVDVVVIYIFVLIRQNVNRG